MRLEISSFADAGDLSKERIVLRALTDVDVGEYVMLRSVIGSTGQEPTAGRKSAYWFPDEEVKSNDLVVLYTKKGLRSKKPLDRGGTVYFFYWGKESPLWGDDHFGAVLMEAADWQFKVGVKATLTQSK